MNRYESLKEEDYREPRCILCDPQTGTQPKADSIPLQRILEKMDFYCDRKEFAAAERHLQYWLEEAKALHDLRGEFSLRNEMMGFYRKQGQKESALRQVQEALRVMKELDNENTISGGTCYVNCGTVYDTFGMPQEALDHFQKAEKILLASSFQDDYKIGSLYNNMALAHMDLGHYRESSEGFRKALEVMRRVPNGEAEQAITYLNMADALALEMGLEKAQEQIEAALLQAEALLNTPSLPRDGYYAFVCEKCAPGFYCYGHAAFGAQLEERAAAIYKESE